MTALLISTGAALVIAFFSGVTVAAATSNDDHRQIWFGRAAFVFSAALAVEAIVTYGVGL